MPFLKVNSKSKIVNRKFSIHNLPLTIHSKVKLGFTLIELLIVMSIIGILAGMLLASYGGAQAKARDTRRKSDLAQIKRGLELAKSDCTSGAFYPYETSYSNLKIFLQPPNNYINPVPDDPNNTGTQIYVYSTSASNGVNSTCPPNAPGGPGTPGASDYALSVQLERTTDTQGPESRTTCNGKPGPVPTAANYIAGYYYVCNN